MTPFSPTAADDTSIRRIEFHGTPALLLESAGGASAVVALHGAQLLSWQPASGREWIYLSPRAEIAPGRAIRGGVPICFPQFSTRGALPKHGFARTCAWTPVAERADGGAALLTLALPAGAGAGTAWPPAARVEFTVLLEDERIDLELAVDNDGTEPLEFTAALHGYFAVADVEDVTIAGLRGCSYVDAAAGDAEGEERGDVVVLKGEHDRVYRDAPGAVLLREPSRALGLHAEGFPDVVVWNPGATRGDALSDLPPGGWRRFVCVEAGAIDRPVVVPAGASWCGRQTLVDLSAAGGSE